METVYIGGGTPSVLSAEQMERLLFVVTEHFQVAAGAEFTVEANPNSLSPGHLAVLKRMHVNRISLGIQSFSDDLLRFLGRSHTARQAEDVFGSLRSAGFGNIALDLIYGIPGQTDALWHASLARAIELGPEHIAVYSLSVDEGARFKKDVLEGKLSLPDDESVARQYEYAIGELRRAGYEQYEISNFSLPGFACRHNVNYWRRGEYLGLGPAAWSFLSNRRHQAIADADEYCFRLGAGMSIVEYEETVDEDRAAAEKVMLGLRTSGGLDLDLYIREYGADRGRRLGEKAVPFERSGLLTLKDGRLRLTKNGFLLANEVLERLIL